jgi:hypothetical protein
MFANPTLTEETAGDRHQPPASLRRYEERFASGLLSPSSYTIPRDTIRLNRLFRQHSR